MLFRKPLVTVYWRKDRDAFVGKYRDLDGNEKRVTLEAKSKRAALRELRKRIEVEVPTGDNVNLQALAKQFLEWQWNNNKPSGVEKLERDLNNILVMGNFVYFDDVAPKYVQQYMDERLRHPCKLSTKGKDPSVKTPDSSRTVSAQQVKHEFSALRNMLNWAVSRELISENPIKAVKAPSVQETDRVIVHRVLLPDEVKRLIDPSIPRWQLWRFLLNTGLRRDEVAQLTWDDLQLNGSAPCVHIRAEKTKSGRADDLPLLPEIAKMMKAYREQSKFDNEDDRVFATRKGNSLYGSMLARLRTALEKAEINPADVDIHSMRKTFITNLLRSGVPPRTVQQLARHKTMRMTMEVYAEVFDNDRREALEMMSAKALVLPRMVTKYGNHKAKLTA